MRSIKEEIELYPGQVMSGAEPTLRAFCANHDVRSLEDLCNPSSFNAALLRKEHGDRAAHAALELAENIIAEYDRDTSHLYPMLSELRAAHRESVEGLD